MTWRDHLPIHPAAELFPLMSELELRELGEDIKKNGLRSPIVLWSSGDDFDKSAKVYLLDGRNRLDAMELVGMPTVDKHGKLLEILAGRSHLPGASGRVVLHLYEFVVSHPLTNPNKEIRNRSIDPYAFVLSANIHRRHLTAEQKRELIAKVLKAKPEASNLQIAKQVKADDKTVAKVRANLEATSEIPKLEKTVGKDGKARPASKPKAAVSKAAEPEPSAEDSAAARRAYYTEHEEAADTDPDKKPNSNRFANARKRRAACDPLITWLLAMPGWELRQVFEAIGVSRILASLPDAWLPAVAQWVAERQSSVPPPAQPRPDQDDLSIPDFMRRGAS